LESFVNTLTQLSPGTALDASTGSAQVRHFVSHELVSGGGISYI
jgi:hypothetical protein